MSNLHRFYLPNAVVFLTSITHHRQPLLTLDPFLDIYWDTLRRLQGIYSFRLIAYVLLPDHFHWLMQLQNETANFSKILQSFKRNFTRNYQKAHMIDTPCTIWQYRFWDHLIRDGKDLEAHFDYIHWNPVKHYLVKNVEDWPHSSFGQWYELQHYTKGWGQTPPDTIQNMEFE
jgi:putative transposase